ncbi:MAG: DNA gyrase subunit A [Candidatus Woesearchaeota archaeon]|nr:DNA gyrase subunit A [Candidatus Woesearchaeota archaeon]
MEESKKEAKKEIEKKDIPEPSFRNLIPREIEDEMQASYIDYAMSVIVGRALPDVRDGLKPAHRRVLYSMLDLGLMHNKPFKKCARIVGDCLGKYHPHGDMAVYDTLVRLAQDFSMRYKLVEGQGNFGSIDGDNAAAMRYTEARLSKISEEMLSDLEKDTVDFAPNFDGTLKEPTVLPSKFPNLLLNGSSGIAVGMATNIPPHNLTEVADAIIAAVDNPEIAVEELMRHVNGPDFPTAGIIYGKRGIKEAYTTGYGKIIVRSRTEIEEHKNRKRIIVKEIPYNIEKSGLIEEIADAIKRKAVEGISDLRDESDKDGIRVVIELSHDANPDVVINQLFKHTRMQSTFGVIMLALVNGAPKVLNLKQLIHYFIEHRKDVVTRRTSFELRKAEEKAHILTGLLIALKDIDNVIRKIKASRTVNDAQSMLEKDYSLSEIQAKAILDLKIQRLASLEQQKIADEHIETIETIKRLKEILASKIEIMKIIRDETLEIKQKYADKRRTEIVQGEYVELNPEDVIDEENVVVTLTKDGYIKRTPLSEFRVQKRGGKGLIGTATKDEDFVEKIKIVNSHSFLLMFTSLGSVHRIMAYDIPESQRNAKGRPVVNFLNLGEKEKVTEIIELKAFDESKCIIISTKKGVIKRASLSGYDTSRSAIRAIILDSDDEVVGVSLGDGAKEIILATKKGFAARFKEDEVRIAGRVTQGVIGVKLSQDDSVVEMIIADESKFLFSVTEKGFGKRTPVSEYRLTGRAVKGVTNIKLSEKTGNVVGVKEVVEGEELMLITKNGSAIRFPVSQASVVGRHAQGVHLIRLDENDEVVSIAKIDKEAINDEKEIALKIDKGNPGKADDSLPGNETEENGTENDRTEDEDESSEKHSEEDSYEE